MNKVKNHHLKMKRNQIVKVNKISLFKKKVLVMKKFSNKMIINQKMIII